jgi:VanZ family protein
MPAGRLSAWLPVVVWAAVIFTFSSIPSLGTGLGVWDVVLRKLAHVAEYVILGVLLARAAGRGWTAIALGSLYAASDELHQAYVPGRVGAPLDWALDTVGVVIGVALLLRRRARPRAVVTGDDGGARTGAHSRAKI